MMTLKAASSRRSRRMSAEARRRHERRLIQASGPFAVFLFATVIGAQTVQGTGTSAQLPVQTLRCQICYIGDGLKISALDTTLADLLAKVAALTGAKIDVPSGAGTQRLPIVDLGPGPEREVLASLLSDASLDYVIQASARDPQKVQSVLVMQREKKAAGVYAALTTGRASQSGYRRAGTPVESPVADNAVAAQENVDTEVSSLNPPPVSAPADTAMPASQSQPDRLNSAKVAPLPPPPTLNPESINQQLKQMYEQRVQINQQTRVVSPDGK